MHIMALNIKNIKERERERDIRTYESFKQIITRIKTTTFFHIYFNQATTQENHIKHTSFLLLLLQALLNFCVRKLIFFLIF